MHPTALKYAKLFSDVYLEDGMFVVEIGSQDVNGSLKDVLKKEIKYIGVDFVEGKNVDVVIDDPYCLPFEDSTVDAVVTSSCFEHSEFFWLSFLEVLRILKPNGLFYLNVPSNGFVHRYPGDFWRFYPDAGFALTNWGEKNGYRVSLVESFVGMQMSRSEAEKLDLVSYGLESLRWNDYVAVFTKNNDCYKKHKNRILKLLDGEFMNGSLEGKLLNERKSFRPQDIILNDGKTRKIETLNETNYTLKKEISYLKRENSSLRKEINNLCESLDDIYTSTSWRITEPLRKLLQFVR